MKMFMFITLLIGISFGPQSTKAVWVYTAHVEWTGYDFTYDSNCGDGTSNTCENKLRIKRTTSFSCSSRSWTEGIYENNVPGNSYSGILYEITWFKTESAPCLTFDVEITENSAGDSTSQYTFTINSDESTDTEYLDLIQGTANGDFTIKYWLESEYFPHQGPNP